ncbi:MAG: MBOAT family O-acyltransferase [Leptospirales bacterium]
MVQPWYIFLLFSSTIIDFATAQWIHRTQNITHRRFFFGLSLTGNLGMLFAFKYTDFFIENLNFLASNSEPGIELTNWLLPVGISFYTFQTLSYTIDVYQKKIEPTKDFIQFAIFVSFFPQLVAGPIERASKLLQQLAKKNVATREDYEMGFQRILWGLVKKLVLADRFAIIVDQVYANPSEYGGWITLLALFCFTLQLYLDFSAYTDIAIGIARIFGIKLSENFDWPYLAENPSEFWSRWHMTLTNWFTDYVYRPLGGTFRNRPLQTFLNITFTMTLIGFWHGAAWNFLLFGLASGIMSASFMFLKLLPRFRRKKLLGNYIWSKPLAIFLNYLMIVIVIGVLFRSENVDTAIKIWSSLLDFSNSWKPEYWFHTILVFFILLGHIIRGTWFAHRKPVKMSPILRGVFWTVLILLLVFTGVEKGSEFIYFQF